MGDNEPIARSDRQVWTARSPAASTKADEKAEVGILIIHGIGEQKYGQTLVDYGDPLLRFVQNWVEGATGGSEPITGRGQDSTEPRQAYKVTAKAAVLSDGTSLDVTPPHVLIEISDVARMDLTRWIVAEAYWADSFPTPHPATVSRWLMRVSPWAWMSFFARRMRLIWLSVLKAKEGGGFRSWAKVVCQLGKLFGLLIITILLSPVVLLLELVLFLLLIAGLIPLPVIHDVITPINSKISSVLGDCFVFDSSIIRLQAVLKRIAGHLSWLESRCHNIVVLGHSQGGALAYLALRDGLSAQVRLLATFGSGLLKLHQIDRQRPLVHVLAWLSMMMSLLLIVVPAELLHVLWVPAGATYVIWFHVCMVLFMFALCIGVAAREDTGSIRDWARLRCNKEFHWLDIYATADPVPNGPLFLDPVPGVESIEVHNEGSLFTSHINYSRNVDEFYPHLITLIGKYGGTRLSLDRLTRNDDRACKQARLQRRVRLFAQSIDSAALLLAAIVILLWNKSVLTKVGEVVRRFGESACQMFGTVYGGTEAGSCWKVSPTVSGIAVLLICWLTLRLAVHFVVSVDASFALSSLYGRSRSPLGSSIIFLFSHSLSFFALLMALQSLSTHVFPWMSAVVNLIPNRHPESLLFWQPYLLALSLALVINTLETATMTRKLREVWRDLPSCSAGAPLS